jgi:hypothetical protein
MRNGPHDEDALRASGQQRCRCQVGRQRLYHRHLDTCQSGPPSASRPRGATARLKGSNARARRGRTTQRWCTAGTGPDAEPERDGAQWSEMRATLSYVADVLARASYRRRATDYYKQPSLPARDRAAARVGEAQDSTHAPAPAAEPDARQASDGLAVRLCAAVSGRHPHPYATPARLYLRHSCISFQINSASAFPLTSFQASVQAGTASPSRAASLFISLPPAGDVLPQPHSCRHVCFPGGTLRICSPRTVHLRPRPRPGTTSPTAPQPQTSRRADEPHPPARQRSTLHGLPPIWSASWLLVDPTLPRLPLPPARPAMLAW